MTIDERARHELFLAAEQSLGRHQTETLMELLPPVGWADVATKQDLRLESACEHGDHRRGRGSSGRPAVREDRRALRLAGGPSRSRVDGRSGSRRSTRSSTRRPPTCSGARPPLQRPDPHPVPEPGRTDDLTDDAGARRPLIDPTTAAGRATGRRPSPATSTRRAPVRPRPGVGPQPLAQVDRRRERQVEAAADVVGVQRQLERHLGARSRPAAAPRPPGTAR